MKPETADYISRVCQDIIKMTSMIREDTNEAVKGDHIGLITHFNQARIVAEQIKEAREALKGIVDYMSGTQVPDAMRAAKVKTITIEGIGRVTISSRFSVSMKDKEAGHDWLKGNGMGDIIIPTVNAQTLSSSIKDWQATTGEDAPEDIFKIGATDYTSITKK